MSSTSPQVDAYVQNATTWQDELHELRSIVLECQLTEDFKWRAPCYTYQGKNVLMIGELKDSCTLSFFKGALLKDPQGILTKPGENTQAARVIRFTSVREIVELEAVLKSYIQEAIEVEKSGLKVDLEQGREFDLPEELQDKLDESPELKTAFEALTPGRQRAYVIFITGAKQSATRAARVEKYVERILAGKGINDCVCGLSQKMPSCDGSHKQLD